MTGPRGLLRLSGLKAAELLRVCNLADYGRDYPGAPPPAADH